MQTYDRSWLPTTPREQVFLFSLSLSLMLNTTVVMLLVTGDLPTLAQMQTGPTPALAEQDVRDAQGTNDTQAEPTDDAAWVDQPSEPQAPDAPQPVVADDTPVHHVVAAPALADDTPVSTPIVSAAPPSISPELIEPAEPVQQAQPQQDDDPVTFFGIGLE